MKWCPRERAEAQLIADAIAACDVPRRGEGVRELVLRTSEIERYRDGVADCFRAVFLRHFGALHGLDEHRATSKRLEHKLVQAHVLDIFAPGTVPVTRGASRLEAVPEGAIVKRAMSDSTGDEQQWQQELVAHSVPAERITDEEWIAQERIDIEAEYRVHTLEDAVVDEMTFLRYGDGDPSPAVRAVPEAFVRSVLDRLPAGIVAGSLCGWDVARTRDGRFIVIEINFTGWHPVYRRGYQTSGYFQGQWWGPKMAARMLRHVRDVYDARIEVVLDTAPTGKEHGFYEEVDAWLRIIDDETLTLERSRQIGDQIYRSELESSTAGR